MGLNTTVVVLNDALHEIKDDPEFGAKLYRACIEKRDGSPEYISAGSYCTAAVVVETHHADHNVLVRVGGNTGAVAT